MFPGETILSGADPKCCGKLLKFEVLSSFGGYYVGTFCPCCGPYTREGEYTTKVCAERDLAVYVKTGVLPNAR